MHFEFLVEDSSGKKALDILVPKIIGSEHTFKIYSYKGIGRIPKNIKSHVDVDKRILLDRLPQVLRGYGKAYPEDREDYSLTVILVCDLDNKNFKSFCVELNAVLDVCNPKPATRFCIAIEEGEAWFLGDIPAIKTAYPHAKDAVLRGYSNDSICGTWEVLADALYKGGSTVLSKLGYKAIGTKKYQWAEKISPHMDITENASPSFRYFRTTLAELATKQ
jgi:hypothetical protein